MKKPNRTARLTIVTFIFAVILVIGLTTFQKPEVQFMLSSDEMAALTLSSKDYIEPEEVTIILNQKEKHFIPGPLNRVYLVELPGSGFNSMLNNLRLSEVSTFKKTPPESLKIFNRDKKSSSEGGC